MPSRCTSINTQEHPLWHPRHKCRTDCTKTTHQPTRYQVTSSMAELSGASTGQLCTYPWSDTVLILDTDAIFIWLPILVYSQTSSVSSEVRKRKAATPVFDWPESSSSVYIGDRLPPVWWPGGWLIVYKLNTEFLQSFAHATQS